MSPSFFIFFSSSFFNCKCLDGECYSCLPHVTTRDGILPDCTDAEESRQGRQIKMEKKEKSVIVSAAALWLLWDGLLFILGVKQRTQKEEKKDDGNYLCLSLASQLDLQGRRQLSLDSQTKQNKTKKMSRDKRQWEIGNESQKSGVCRVIK